MEHNTLNSTEFLKSTIRSIPDFPQKGIVFRDITTLLKDANAFKRVVNLFCQEYKGKNISKIVSIESRGFIFGAALAYTLDAGFVPIRKKGKLPAETIREEYQLEYGTDLMEMHADAVRPGDRVVVHDDLLATGGTMEAACKLVERLGGEIIGLSFLIELSFLNGRDKIKQYPIQTLITYESE